MIGIKHSCGGFDAIEGDLRLSIPPATAKRLIMGQQPDAVAVDAMDAGMQHGTSGIPCCLISAGSAEDGLAENREAVCGDSLQTGLI